MKYFEHSLRRKIRRVILENLDDDAWAAHADALDKKQKDEKSEKAAKGKFKKHLKKKSDLKKEVAKRLNNYSEDIMKSISISIKKGSLSPLLIKIADDSVHKYYDIIKISPKIKLKGKKLQNHYKIIIRLGSIEIEVSSNKREMKEEENRGKNISAIYDLHMTLSNPKIKFNTNAMSDLTDLEKDHSDYIKSLPSNFKKANESNLRREIRAVIKESGLEVPSVGGGMRSTSFMPNSDDRRFATISPSKQSIQSSDVSQTDSIKLMSASTGFFQTLVDAIRFGFVTRGEVDRICTSLERGCEDNFKSLTINHPCLKSWKNDISKISERIPDDSDFKREFRESVISNCEMVRSNYDRAQGNIKQIAMK